MSNGLVEKTVYKDSRINSPVSISMAEPISGGVSEELIIIIILVFISCLLGGLLVTFLIKNDYINLTVICKYCKFTQEEEAEHEDEAMEMARLHEPSENFPRGIAFLYCNNSQKIDTGWPPTKWI